MNKSFIEIFNESKEKFKTTCDVVIYELIFFLSTKVKDKTSFILNTNNKIDFSYRHFKALLIQYFIKKKPLAQITGKTSFCSYDFVVCKKILVPRQETEILVSSIDNFLQKDKKLISLLDVCCGTGNIGISLKLKNPNIFLSLLDVNTKAIKNVVKNIHLHNIDAKTINKNIFTFLKSPSKHDVIVCNPPYVAKHELNHKMIKYESRISFINSKTPLDFYLILLNNINQIFNNPNHFLLGFEISPFIKKDLESAISNLGLSKYTTWFKDLENNDRGFIIYKNC